MIVWRSSCISRNAWLKHHRPNAAQQSVAIGANIRAAAAAAMIRIGTGGALRGCSPVTPQS
jgi:hypothetical protein